MFHADTNSVHSLVSRALLSSDSGSDFLIRSSCPFTHEIVLMRTSHPSVFNASDSPRLNESDAETNESIAASCWRMPKCDMSALKNASSNSFRSIALLGISPTSKIIPNAFANSSFPNVPFVSNPCMTLWNFCRHKLSTTLTSFEHPSDVKQIAADMIWIVSLIDGLISLFTSWRG